MNPTDNGSVRVKLSNIDDSKSMQTAQTSGRHNETIGGKKHGAPVQHHYGFTYHAPVGSYGYYGFLNGSPDQSYITALDHPDYRPTGLAEGEWKLYTKWNKESGVDQKPARLYAQEKKWTLFIGDNKVTFDVEHKQIKIETKETSILMDDEGKKIVFKADKFIFDGECKLGGGEDDTYYAASRLGTVDSSGDTDVSNTANKVFVR